MIIMCVSCKGERPPSPRCPLCRGSGWIKTQPATSEEAAGQNERVLAALKEVKP